MNTTDPQISELEELIKQDVEKRVSSFPHKAGEYLEVNVSLKKVCSPLVVIHIDTQQNQEIVKRKKFRFYARQLTDQELTSLANLVGETWLKGIIEYFAQNKNQEISGKSLMAVAREAGYPHEYIGSLSQNLNANMNNKNMPFRLTHATQKALSEDLLFRFYRVVEQ